MIRRPGLSRAALKVGAIFALAGLSACDKFEENETAATVNGHELSLDQLDELVEGNDDPTIRRSALSAWIQVVAASENPGELLTEEALAAQREIVLPPLIEASKAEAKEQYEQGLQGSEVLCLAVIPLPADVPSQLILDELKDGTSFAELAAEYSEDPSLVETGGVISVDGQECLPTGQWNANLIDELTTNRLVVGEPGVISLNAAEVIVLLRPYDDLNANSHQLLAEGPVSELLLELYRAADVTVHESFGEWDGEQGVIVDSSSHE